MLEAILIISIVYACMYMPLRGKTFDKLTPSQQQKVEKNYHRYLKTRKGKQTPNMRIEEYLPILQKQALTYLIMAIVILPIYILVVVFLYSKMML
jgi:hypothetical protein